MKPGIRTILFIMTGVLLCVLCLLICLYYSANPYTKVIEKNWGIELSSKGAKDVCSYSEPSPHGDGIRYHVIEYSAGNASEAAQSAVSGLEELFVHSSRPTEEQVLYVTRLLENIGVSPDVIPDWSTCDLIYRKQADNSELFLFYPAGTATLYVVESFL